MRHFNLLSALFAVGLVGCQAAPFPSAPLRQAPRVVQNIRNANAPRFTRQSDHQVREKLGTHFLKDTPVAVYPNRLVFEGQQLAFEKGNILIGRSRRNEDYLRRIEKITVAGGRTLVDTTDASLFEAFDELSLRGLEMDPDVQGLRKEHRVNIGGVMDLVLDLNIRPDFSDTELHLKDKRLRIKSSPVVQLNTQLRGELRFRPLLSEVEPQPVGEVSFTAASFPLWLGPVPVSFTLRPGAALDYGHEASGSAGIGGQLNGEVKATVELEAALNQQPELSSAIQHQLDASWIPPELKLEGSARARVHVPRMQIDLKVASMVGPFVQLGTYVDSSYTRRYSYSSGEKRLYESVQSHLGLAAYGGITPTKIFGKQLSKEIRIKIIDKNLKQIYNRVIDRPVGAEAL